MPWKQTEHQYFSYVLSPQYFSRKPDCKSSDSKKEKENNCPECSAMKASKNGKGLGKSSQKNKTNCSPAPTVVGAVAAISLMCIFPMAMAYGPSSFFPRLPIHKVMLCY